MKLPYCICLRCGHGSDPLHRWYPRKPEKPARCPKCGSAIWHKPKEEKPS